MKTMTFNMTRCTCSQLTVNDKDATACYDHVLPPSGMTMSRSWGPPPKAAEMHGRVPLGMKLKTKTIHGVSEEGCCDDDEHTAHGGTGQGSGGGPMLWSGMGTSTQQTHKRTCPQPMTHASPNKQRKMSRSSDKHAAHGGMGQGSGGGPMLWSGTGTSMQQTHKRTCPQPMTHASPNKQRKTSRSSDKCADDATLGTNDQTAPTEWTHSTEQATMASQQWANLLEATGGSLNLKERMLVWHPLEKRRRNP